MEGGVRRWKKEMEGELEMVCKMNKKFFKIKIKNSEKKTRFYRHLVRWAGQC